MKFNHKVFITATLFLSLTLVFDLSAQVEWIGGFPAQETNWDQPANWSTNQVPGINDVVLIPSDAKGSFFPVIDDRIAPIGYLMVESGAELTVEYHGQLRIDGADSYTFGIYLRGNLDNLGTIIIEETSGNPIIGDITLLKNEGAILLANKESYSVKAFEPEEGLHDLEELLLVADLGNKTEQ